MLHYFKILLLRLFLNIIIVKMNRLVNVWSVGKISYLNGLKLQKYLADLHHNTQNNSIKDTLLLVEHSPVYTIGLRTKNYSKEDEERLTKLGADFFKTNRGGLITFHGPGQLVVYPILNLKNFKPSIKWYVCHIEKTIIHLCKQLGINAETSPHTGVWIGDNKVCAIGMHASRYVTTHGLALNCNTDLDWYKHIIPCGIEDKGITSLSKELKKDVHVEEIAPLFLESFSKIFQSNYCNFPKDEADRICTELNLSL